MLLYLLFYTFYPIIGYIIGRGFVSSVDSACEVLKKAQGDPLGALKIPLYIVYVLLCGKVH